jgi:hypothetical protein
LFAPGGPWLRVRMIGILALPAVLKKAPEEAEPSQPDLQIGRGPLLPGVSGHNKSASNGPSDSAGNYA